MNKWYKLYEVGGCIRDGLLGIPTKDIDYSFVWNNVSMFDSIEEAFHKMEEVLTEEGFRIFKSFPEFFTIRAKFPKDHKYSGDADFVMARKEVKYIDGTRKPISIPGELKEDLSRRDFTINALARGEDGNLIDMFGGLEHLHKKLLVTPLDPNTTFSDDPLRILRGLRFCVTKGFTLGSREINAIENFDTEKMKVVSVERKIDELTKMFKHNTELTLDVLHDLKFWNKELWLDIVDNSQGMWFIPTNKKR